MKKLCCLVLSLCFMLSLCACKKKTIETIKPTIDLKQYAKLGQIPEAGYSLGADIDKVIEELTVLKAEDDANHQEDPTHNHDHDEEEFRFEVFEGENNVLIDNGIVNYYYHKADKSAGISCIVVYDTAFGFSLGTLISDIKRAASDIEFKEEIWTEESNVPVTNVTDGTILTAKFDESTIVFLFQENELYATVMYNDNWSD